MAALKPHIKIYIVQSLACYLTPKQVSTAVKEEFGLIVERQQVHLYDPTKVLGRTLSKALKELFYETREKFKQTITDIPVANQAYRLATIQRLIDKNIERNNDVMVANLLKQGAQDLGGIFSNLIDNNDNHAKTMFQNFYDSIKGSSIPIVYDLPSQTKGNGSSELFSEPETASDSGPAKVETKSIEAPRKSKRAFFERD